MNSYVWQKTREAVNALIFGTGDIRARVWEARWALQPLKSETLSSEELKTLFANVTATVDAGDKPDNTTLFHMDDAAVSNCAKDMLRMFELSLALSPVR